MAVLTRNRLAERLVEETGVSHREARELVDLFFDTVADTLQAGEEVLLSGFGRFRLLDKAARPGQNPRTGAPARVDARRIVSFRASTGLRARTRLRPPAPASGAEGAARANPEQPGASASGNAPE